MTVDALFGTVDVRLINWVLLKTSKIYVRLANRGHYHTIYSSPLHESEVVSVTHISAPLDTLISYEIALGK